MPPTRYDFVAVVQHDLKARSAGAQGYLASLPRPRIQAKSVHGVMMSILVADDAPGVRKLLRLILEPGHQIFEAADGGEAFRMLIEHQPRIAIIDISMPVQNGIEVCRQLRQDPRTAATGVIVITANGTPRDRAAALEAGADYFLTKPFSPGVIVRLVESLLSERQTAPTG
jgi:CheY-like chemotaxis protein